MYLAIQFECNYGKWDKLTEAEWDEVREAIPSIPKERPPYGEVHGTHYLTMENAAVLAKHDIRFCLSREAESKTVGSMLVKLQNRIAALELRNPSTATAVAAGATVQIHIPSFCLMNINEVMVMEDCCTDRLQDELDNGYRILAVCPPCAQRRPDYILGRNKS